MRKKINRVAFTLIEMMTVVAIAVMVLGLTVGSMRNLSDTNSMAMGASLLSGMAAKARTLAMSTRREAFLIFLDAGRCNNDGPINSAGGPWTAKTDVAEVLAGFYETPAELIITQKDEAGDYEIIDSAVMPVGVAWHSQTRAADASSSSNLLKNTAYGSEPEVATNGTNASLRIPNRVSTYRLRFNPDGSALTQTAVESDAFPQYKRTFFNLSETGNCDLVYSRGTRIIRLFQLDQDTLYDHHKDGYWLPNRFSTISNNDALSTRVKKHKCARNSCNTSGSSIKPKWVSNDYTGFSSAHDYSKGRWVNLEINEALGLVRLVGGANEE